LKDLDFKASDILLSNGVIWVEGPSDALYLELLFDLYKTKKNLTSKFNYCIQALSTAIWKYAGFSEFDWEKVDSTTENQIISLAKINHSHIIIIDNDNNYEDKKPSQFEYFSNKMGQNKARLLNESMKFGNYLDNQLENNYGDSKDGKLFFWEKREPLKLILNTLLKTKGRVLKNTLT
jgi:putative ATP-dependent endonuclease of the OLD family